MAAIDAPKFVKKPRKRRRGGRGKRSAAYAHIVHEAADAVYHLLVLLAFSNVDLAEVEAELAGRFGISGLEEKAGRNKDGGDKSAGERP